jgi:hypothetical protein
MTLAQLSSNPRDAPLKLILIGSELLCRKAGANSQKRTVRLRPAPADEGSGGFAPIPDIRGGRAIAQNRSFIIAHHGVIAGIRGDPPQVFGAWTTRADGQRFSAPQEMRWIARQAPRS